jgi:hypothetical protein
MILDMKYLLILLLCFSTVSFAEEQKSCEQLQKEGFTQEQLAQRGCCSWHGGVCGCTGGRAVCCDGKLSPSCGCHSEDSKFYLQGEKEELKT